MNILIKLNEAIKNLFDRIGDNSKVDNLFLFRIFIGFTYLFSVQNIDWISMVPENLYRPDVLNFTNLFQNWPPSFIFKIIYYTCIISCLFIIIGIKTRLNFIILSLLLLFQNGFLYSFGKIDHGILYSILPLYMAFTNSGNRLALIPDRIWNIQKISTSIFSIVICFGFFTAGYEKFFSWVDFDLNTSGFLAWYYNGFYILNRNELLSNYVPLIKPPVTELIDYLAVFFELSGIFFLIYSRKSWFIYLVVASVFHFMNTLLLNIPFKIHILVFSIWLLTPQLKKYPWIGIILPITALSNNLIITVILWFLLVMIGIYSCYISRNENIISFKPYKA